MKKIFYIFLIVSLTFALYANDSYPNLSDSNDDIQFMPVNDANNTIENEDEEEIVNHDPKGSKGTSSIKQSKQTLKPGEPKTSSMIESSADDSGDPEKQKELTKDGVRQVEFYLQKGNSKALAKILNTHSIPAVRAEAAKALGRFPKSVKVLHHIIDQDGYEVRQAAYKSLEKIASRSSIKYFLSGTKSTDTEIKISSLIGLGKTKSSVGREAIIKVGLTSKDPKVISASLDALGHFSRKDDLEIFKTHLKSENSEQQNGAVRGLGNSKLPETLEILYSALIENPNLEPEIIYAIDKKKTLNSTLLLIKMMQATKNENYQTFIQNALYSRKAFGKYAIIVTPTASIRKAPKARSEKIISLIYNDVARIKKATEKKYKVRMNGNILENRYYQLQALASSPKDPLRKTIVEGWVFGAKINIITINNPNRVSQKKTSDSLHDEDSEDEIEVIATDTKDKPKNNINNKPENGNQFNKDSEYIDEEEDDE